LKAYSNVGRLVYIVVVGIFPAVHTIKISGDKETSRATIGQEGTDEDRVAQNYHAGTDCET
jgi:hypothetical protein